MNELAGVTRSELALESIKLAGLLKLAELRERDLIAAGDALVADAIDEAQGRDLLPSVAAWNHTAHGVGEAA